MTELPFHFERVRHELKFRICTLVEKTFVTPQMVRVRITSPELAGFESLGFDDHVKLFFAVDGEELVMPIAGPNGPEYPKDRAQPVGRDFTPVAFDPASNELTLDFAIHGSGPATEWAQNAQPGDQIGVGGPRGSFVLRGKPDWHLLIGDQTALPAIVRRMMELDENEKVTALIEVADAQERQTIACPSSHQINWAYREDAADPATVLDESLSQIELPQGIGFVFIAGEAETSKRLAAYLVEKRGLARDQIKAAGYWRRGEADFYDGQPH